MLRPSVRVSAVALVLASSRASAAVDRDCFAGSEAFICNSTRLEDARLADQLAQPVLARAGWAQGCYRVLFSRGDDGGPGALLVTVDGPRGGKAPSCQKAQPAELTREEAKRISDRGGDMQEMLKAISEKTIKKGKAESATSAELRKIGLAIRKAILAAPTGDQARILKGTRRLVLGSGFGGEFETPLP